MGVFVVEHRHPLAQGSTLDFRQQRRPVCQAVEIGTILQLGPILQHIGRNGSQDATEAIGCRAEVVGTQPIPILLALQVEASPRLVQLFEPAMQLCEIGKAALGIAVIVYLLGKLLFREALPRLHLLTQNLTHLIGGIRIAQVEGSITVYIIQYFIGQRARGLLTIGHDAQCLAGHLILVAIHPREQTTVAQALPLVVRTVLIAKGMDDFRQRHGRMLCQEGYLLVNLVYRTQDGDTDIYLTVGREIAAYAADVGLGMGLDIQEEGVVGISQRDSILLLIAQDGDGHTMKVVAQIASHILVRIGGLHHIDGCHQTGPLVYGIAVDNDILHSRAELHITALLQPACDTSVVEVVDGKTLVVDEQGDELVHIVCHQVLLGVYNEAAIF